MSAEIVCLATLPIISFDTLNYSIDLAGDNLVFMTNATTLSRYDLATGITSPVTSDFSSTEKSFDLDGDHIVFVDQVQQIQLYTISTGSTTAITGGNKQYSDPRIEGNNVVYRKKKQTADDKVFYKLYVYDIAGETTTVVGHKYPKHYDYDLNQGRILWGGNNLYTIATGINISLGSYEFVDLDGNHVVTVVSADYASNVILKDLSSGTISQLTHYSSGEIGEFIYINNVVLDGDYVAWAVEINDTEGSYGWVIGYQISTGKYIDPGIPENSSPFAGISEPFLTGKILDASSDYWHLYLYDLPSTSLTPMVYGDYVASITHVFDNRNIAWVGAKYDPVIGETYDPQIFLRTDCGSTPKIIEQSHDLNILTGRSAELYVTTSANQPITYQWYQGEQGDTSTPVGTNSSIFTTPPLTQPTSYWVHAVNLYGAEDSDLITITPGDTVELIVDGSFEQSLYVDSPAWLSKQAGHTVYQTYNQSEEPPVVHTGEYALAVEGDVNFPKAKVKQVIAAVPYQPGDQLKLSAWLMAKQLNGSPIVIQLRVQYADGVKTKAIIKPTLATFDYTLFNADPLIISDTVQDVRVQIKYANKEGQWILDDLSVTQSPGSAASAGVIPLPSGLTRSK
ncbi:MAG: hypothetical protein H7X77_05175 [Anaerolineae bacterium]|nr:hypothetical protein [Anaerolineae bacterium]